MKKLTVCLLFSTFILACKRDVKVLSIKTSSSIEGLELSFFQTDLNANCRKVLFLNENTGFVADYGGGIFKSMDGGITWINKNTGNALPIFDIFFLNSKEGFAVGGRNSCGGTGCLPPGAILLHTTDGGENWSKVNINLQKKIELNAVQFINDSLGFAVGGASLLITRNRGLNWDETFPPAQNTVFMDVKFKDPEHGIIVGTFGKVMITSDGGKTWTSSQPFEPGGINSISLPGSNLAFATSAYKTYKSSDFGVSWKEFNERPAGTSGLIFTSADEGYSFGMGEYSGGDFGTSYAGFHYTIDGGKSWKGNTKITEMGPIQSACLINSRQGVAISNNILLRFKRN